MNEPFVFSEFRKSLKLTQEEFAKKCGTTLRTVQNWEQGTRIPEQTMKLFHYIEREMLSGDVCVMSEKPSGSNLAPVDDSKNDFRLVPLINIDAVGGVHSQNLISNDEQYIMRHLAFSDARENDVAIFQSGSSMSPTIPSGSVLLIRKVDGWQEYFGYGSIYVLLLADGRRITKEIRKSEIDPQNYVLCASYNPDVADEELPRNFIVEVWKVVKYITDFGW